MNWKNLNATKYDLLVAGFPCQPFSKAGKNLGVHDSRGLLYERVLEIIEECKPKAILIENVLNITKPPHNKVIEVIKQKLNELDYSIGEQILNSLDFGSKQNRIRLFIYGKQKKLNNQKLFPILKKEKKFDKPIITEPINTEKIKQSIPFKECTNYYVIPRAKDGQMISGSYNRIWKLDGNKIGTIAASTQPKIGYINNKNQLCYWTISPIDAWTQMGFLVKNFQKINDAKVNTIMHAIGNSIHINVLKFVLRILNDDEKK